MRPHIIYIIGIIVSLLIFIEILGRYPKSKRTKIILLAIANMIAAGSMIMMAQHKAAVVIPIGLTFLVLDIAGIRKILSKENPERETLNAWHDDPANWRAGVFYYNPKDKRIFPPKRIEGFGWTVNFANPYSVLVMILLLAIVLLFITYAKSLNSFFGF
jgi:uncharacterized membrane protein